MLHQILSSVQSLSCVQLCDPMDCSTPGFPIYHQLPEFTQIHVHWVGDAIQPSHPLSSHSPLAFNLSKHQGLFQESILHFRWPKYWRISFSISPLNEYSGLISFRMDWMALLAVQGTLKSLLQHHSLKASILWCSAFFRVQLLHLYISSVQLSRSVVSNSVTPWTAACQASLSITNSCSLLKLMSIGPVMPSNRLIFCRPLPYLLFSGYSRFGESYGANGTMRKKFSYLRKTRSRHWKDTSFFLVDWIW